MLTALAAAPEMTSIASWLNTAFAAFDESAAIAVHKLYELAPGFFTPFLTFITLLGKEGIFLIILSLTLTLFRPTRRYGAAMFLGIAIGALITNLTVKPLVARPRPYTWDGSVFQQFWIELGRHTESDKSFPSGHMTAAMAASTALFLRGNKKISWTAFLFAILMGISRIYLSVHYATDVLGGVITGGIGGVLGYWVSTKLPERFYTGGKGGRRTRTDDDDEPEEDDVERREIVLDGKNFSDLGGFYAEISELLGPPDGRPVRNLDGLNDLLRGGLGEAEAYEPLHIRWKHSKKSSKDLGYDATADYYEEVLERCHPSNREKAERRLEAAEDGRGPTLFDMIVTLMRRTDTGHDCTLSLE